VAEVFFLVLDDLTIQLVNQTVNGCVHIGLGVCREQVSTVDMNGGFSFLDQFFDLQDDMNVHHLIKVPRQSGEFVVDVVPHRFSDVNLMACDGKLHGMDTPLLWLLKNLFSLAGGRYRHGLPVFGDGSAGHIDTPALQLFGDGVIAEWLARVFATDDFLQVGLDGSG
jgi:hypothetical protein